MKLLKRKKKKAKIQPSSEPTLDEKDKNDKLPGQKNQKKKKERKLGTDDGAGLC